MTVLGSYNFEMLLANEWISGKLYLSTKLYAFYEYRFNDRVLDL